MHTFLGRYILYVFNIYIFYKLSFFVIIAIYNYLYILFMLWYIHIIIIIIIY